MSQLPRVQRLHQRARVKYPFFLFLSLTFRSPKKETKRKNGGESFGSFRGVVVTRTNQANANLFVRAEGSNFYSIFYRRLRCTRICFVFDACPKDQHERQITTSSEQNPELDEFFFFQIVIYLFVTRPVKICPFCAPPSSYGINKMDQSTSVLWFSSFLHRLFESKQSASQTTVLLPI